MTKQFYFTVFTFISLGFFITSCTKDQMQTGAEKDNELLNLIRSIPATNGDVNYYVFPEPTDYANIPQDPKNPLTKAKVDLGKFLFFDTGLGMDAKYDSGLGTYSCATCHIPSAGFRPGAAQGIADGGIGFGTNGEDRLKNPDYQPDELDTQSARPLSLVNVAYVKNTFWNGQFGATGINENTEELWGLHRPASELNELGFEGIETQNIEGLHTHRYTINEDILEQYGYTEMFDEALPDLEESERYSLFGASLAISAYIRTILATEAPFQKYLKGDFEAMDYEEKEGAILFFGKAKCTNCHYRENLGSLEFHALGVKDLDQDMEPTFNTSPTDFRNFGRGSFTGIEEDNYKYKVPGIYNMSDTPFYFHGSSKKSLTELIEYKNDRIPENPRVPLDRISDEFEALNLTVVEKQSLVKFLEHSLRDPDLMRYQPESVPSGSCFPNNDSESRIDLGCN